ncbi:MAG: hypothetical protein D8M58_07235 [Calditrichaeota bacterium]|nr:MAG: hypothetical protein DWQ03_19255 [Calditrichota bacterium]MBL1205174.1 hypothetical protein [Calditrichota bacterium]NOG45004.1 hypothetical protein [Calditrichota bacterium]
MLKQSSWLSVGIVAAIIIFLNMIASNISGRFDLTENDVYTMSDVTKNILEDIDEPVTVKIYYSEKFPRQLLTVKQYVFDLLQEYKSYAGSGLEYEFSEIGEGSDDIKQEAQGYGVSPVQANIRENDQLKVQNIYLGVAFLYGDKKEALPFIQQIEQLEYQFTGAIKRLTQGGKTKIGYITGFDEISIDPPNPYAALQGGNQQKPVSIKNLLTQVNSQFELTKIDLNTTEKIPAEIQEAIILEPKKEYSAKAKYILDQFLMRGGKLGVFVNRHRVDFQNAILPIMPIRFGLDDFFTKYGFKINDNLIVDKQSAQVQMMQQLGPIQLPVAVDYPFAARVTNFNEDNPIVSRLNETVFFFSSSIDSIPTPNVKFTPLIQSSEESGFAMKDPQRGMYNINPQQPFAYNQSKLNLAAIVEGKFQSNFATRPDTIAYPDAHLSEATMDGKILVFSDADFVKDEYSGPQNATLFMNVLDWLVDENGLISIRNKKIENRPLDKEILAENAVGTRDFIKIINVYLVPVLVILFGLVKWYIRRRTKQLASVA